MRVLAVDDQPDFAELVADLLEREDERFRVDSTTSIEAGLDRLAENAYDCIVSDYDMPDRTGIEFLQAVRQTHPDLPFILFTGKGSEEIASEAITAGVTDYLQKRGGSDQYTLLANRIMNVVKGYQARRIAEQRARRLQRIKENVSDVIWISSPEKDSIEFITDSYEDVWGQTPDSLIRDPSSFLEHIHEEDRERVRNALSIQRTNPAEYEETYRVVRPDGSVRWVKDRSAGIYEDGELTGAIGIATDITELKEYEQELQEETVFNESALEIAVDFYWGIDLDGHVTRWSDKEGAVTGYPENEAIGLHTSTFHPDDHFPRIEAAIEEMRDTGSTVVEADFLTKRGERIPFEFAGRVILGDDGEVRSMCGVARENGDSGRSLTESIGTVQ